MTNKEYPDFLRPQYGNCRQFKAQKRRELRALRKAFVELRWASAFVVRPAQDPLDQIKKSIEELEKLLSVKEWGR